MTKTEIATLLGVVRLAWQNFDAARPGLVELWLRILGMLDYEEAHRALESIIADGKDYPPTPGHILRRWMDAQKPIQTAGEAINCINIRLKLWRPPTNKIQHHPSREELEKIFHDRPRTLRALLAVGVQRWRDTSEQDRAFLYRDFSTHFHDLGQAQEQRERRYITHKGIADMVTHLAAGSQRTELDRMGAEHLARLTAEERKAVISEVLHGLTEDEFEHYRVTQKNDRPGAEKMLLSWVGELALTQQTNEEERCQQI